MPFTGVLFPMNFLSFNDKGFSLDYKPSDNEHTPASGEIERFYLPPMTAPCFPANL